MLHVLPGTTDDNTVSGDHLVTTLHASLPKLTSYHTCESSTVNRKGLPSILINGVLYHQDPRMQSEEANRARKRETEKQVVRGTCESFSKEMYHMDRMSHLAR